MAGEASNTWDKVQLRERLAENLTIGARRQLARQLIDHAVAESWDVKTFMKALQEIIDAED